jgi:hypothetical protein
MFHATYTAHFIRTIEPLLQRFLPPSLVVLLKEDGPDVMLKVFDRDHETPELIWNGAMRGELRAALAEQLDSFVKRRTKPDAETRDFILSPNARAKYKNLEGELYIGGVYVRLFLKEPTFNLRDPTSFLEKLLIRWTHELEVYTSSNKKKGGMDEPNASNGAVSAAKQDALQLVTSASIYLCKVRDSLCDKLAQWGYMTRALAMMHEVLACKLIGAPLLSIMRILHVASNRLVNVESLAVAGDSGGKSGVVYYTIQAIGRDPLHKDCAFMVEVLLKVFRKALGDVKNASKVAKVPSLTSSGREDLHMYSSSNTVPAAQQQFRYSPTAHTMAPSPAPGLEPVRKSAGKAKIEHPLDHPLAFGGPDMTTSNQAAAPPPGARFGSGRHIASQHDHPLASPLAAGNQPAVHPLSHPSNRTNFLPQPSQSHPNQAQGTQTAGYYSSSQPANFQSTVAPSLVPLSHAPYSYIQTSNLPFGGNAAPYAMQTQPAPHLVGEQYTQSRMQQATMQHSSQMLSRSHQQVNTPYPSAPMQPSFGTLGTTHQASSQGAPSNNKQDVPVQASGAQTAMPSPTSFPSQPAPVRGGEQYFQSSGMQQPAVQHANPMLSPIQQETQVPYQSAPMQPSIVTPGTTQPPQLTTSSPSAPSKIMQHVPSEVSGTQQTFMPSPASFPLQPPRASGGAQYSHSSGMQQPSIQQANPMLSSSQKQAQAPYQSAPMQPALGAQGPIQSSQPLVSAQGDTQHVAGQPVASSPAPTPQYLPTPIAGNGIDARSSMSPMQKAEQQILSSAGAPGSAQGRVALLQSALVCELPKFLVEGVLENPSLSTVKDPAAAKVHSVELLKLLTLDPGYGLKIQLILKEIPAWKKYKSQDHSLFITGAEQKTDYFLTDGEKEPAKLLTDG